MTPLGVVARGLLAGAAGTAAMDLVLYRRYRRGGGDQPVLDWEFSAGLADWEQAPAPAQVGRRVIEGVFRTELAPRWARSANNVTHWAYGLAWGAQYSLVAGSLPRPRVAYGVVLGAVAWGSGYVVLPLAKLYKPVWEYDAVTLARDLSAHVVYGVVTAATFGALPTRSRRGYAS